MRTETLIEGRPSLLALDRESARHLEDVGRQLASKKTWWGGNEPSVTASLIACREMEPGIWEVIVRDAVGLVSLADTQIIVEPKIPRNHLLYLFGLSGALPRLAGDKGAISAGADLWELIATWFLRRTEEVLRRDLVHDYLEYQDEIAVVRGRVEPIPSATSLYRGRVLLHCEFEELGIDTPLNRVLRAASRVVAQSPELPWEIRRGAMRVIARMEDVGDLRPADTQARLDRRTAHYADALVLSRHILGGQRRTLEHGDATAWTFLIRTPDLVEDGLREAIRQRLPYRSIKRATIALKGTTMTANPDLFFDDGLAVGDVKYKLAGSDWNRGDLYQAVAFAAAARTTHASIVGFQTGDHPTISMVQWGDIQVRAMHWNASGAIDPNSAADELATEIDGWLSYAQGGG